jgi:hypothetical protein
MDTRFRLAKRWLWQFAPLSTLFVSGCMIPVFYALPAVSVVPPLQAGPPCEAVRAFRVDATRTEKPLNDASDRTVLQEIPLSESGRSQLQGKVAIDYGWFVLGLCPGCWSHTRHRLQVRLYRAGFATIEVSEWAHTVDLAWLPAADLQAQEKAVDNMVHTARTEFRSITELPTGEFSQFNGLAPGSASPAHKQALQFAVMEYDRLATLAVLPGENDIGHAPRSRLKDKADVLRELASR